MEKTTNSLSELRELSTDELRAVPREDLAAAYDAGLDLAADGLAVGRPDHALRMDLSAFRRVLAEGEN